MAREIIPKGMWLEELEPGLVVQHALTRTVTEADNVGFTVSTMNPAPLHLDADYASTTQFGKSTAAPRRSRRRLPDPAAPRAGCAP